jgi:hypothetical protein
MIKGLGADNFHSPAFLPANQIVTPHVRHANYREHLPTKISAWALAIVSISASCSEEYFEVCVVLAKGPRGPIGRRHITIPAASRQLVFFLFVLLQ